MKKLLLVSAIATLSVSAQAAPQVYGRAFLTVDYDNSTKSTTLKSNASRIGFKGSEALTANTDVVYQLEYGVNVAAETQFSSRDNYLGLSNKQYGTLLAGRLSAIDGMVDYANVTQGNVIGKKGVRASFDAERADNTFAYISPDYNGVTAFGMYQVEATKGHYGVGARYEPKGAQFRAGASYIKNPTRDTIVRVSGSYDVTPDITVGALYQNHSYKTSSNKENNITISGRYKTATPLTAYGQLDILQNQGGTKNSDSKRLVIGGEYAFNKATTGHVYAGAIAPKTGKKQYGVGGGLEYRF